MRAEAGARLCNLFKDAINLKAFFCRVFAQYTTPLEKL